MNTSIKHANFDYRESYNKQFLKKLSHLREFLENVNPLPRRKYDFLQLNLRAKINGSFQLQ